MTYNEFIQNILDTRGRFNIPDDEYHERHHIKPKCLGGDNDEENLIDLYPEEHYDAHRMLAEENPMCIGLLYARFRMAGGGGKTKMRPAMSQEEYSEARKNYADYLEIEAAKMGIGTENIVIKIPMRSGARVVNVQFYNLIKN